MRKRVIITAILLILSVGLPLSAQTKSKASAKPTVADAEKFMNDTEAQLLDLSIKAGRAAWVQSNFITDDTEALAADANERYIEATTKIARDIKGYDGVKLPPVLARKFLLLKLQLFSLSNPKERAEYATLASGLEGSYGKGKACLKEGKNAGKCLPIGEVEQVFAESRDPEELKQVWTAWHEVGMAKDSSGETMRKRYARFIELQNKGAQELGYKDMGAMWRAGYDMSPEQFSAEVERIWNQVRPLYESLHAYARTQLIKKYGPQAVTKDGLIRADLLGNPWAQQWNNVYPLLAPPTTAKGYDLTEILKEKKIDELGMVRYGENFFKSLGFEPLPQTFWERSLFIKPRATGKSSATPARGASIFKTICA